MSGQVTSYVQSGNGRGISFPIRELLGDNKKGILIGDGGNSVYRDSNDIATSHTPINNRNENPAIALLRERMKDHIKTAGIFYAKKPPIYDPKKPLDPKAPKVAVHGRTGKEIKYPVESTEFKSPVDEAIARAHQVRENVQQAAKAGKPVSKEDLTAAREAAKALHAHAKDVKYPRLKAKVETPEQAAAAAGRVYDPKGTEKGVIRPTFLARRFGYKPIEFPHTGEKPLNLRPSNVSEEEYLKNIKELGEKAPEYIEQQKERALKEVHWGYRSSAKKHGDKGILSRPLPFSSLRHLGSDAMTAIKNLAGRAKMDVGKGIHSVRTRAAKAISPDPAYGATEVSRGLTDLINKLEKTKPENKEEIIRQIGAHRALKRHEGVLEENLPKGFIEAHKKKTEDLGLPTGMAYPRSVIPGKGESMTAEEEAKELGARISGQRATSRKQLDEERAAAKIEKNIRKIEKDIKGDGGKATKPATAAVPSAAPAIPGGPSVAGGPGVSPGYPHDTKSSPSQAAAPAQAPAPQAPATTGSTEYVSRAMDVLDKVKGNPKAEKVLHDAIPRYQDKGGINGLMNAVAKALSEAGVKGAEHDQAMHAFLRTEAKVPGGPGGMQLEASPGGAVKFTQTAGAGGTPQQPKPARVYDIQPGPEVMALKGGLESDPLAVQWKGAATDLYKDFDAYNPAHVTWARQQSALKDLTAKMDQAGHFVKQDLRQPVRRTYQEQVQGAPQPAPQVAAQSSPQAISGGPQKALSAPPVGAAGVPLHEELQTALGRALQPLLAQQQRQMIPAPQKQKEIAALMQATGMKAMPAWAEQMLPMAGIMFSMMLADQLGMEGMVPSMAAMFGGPILASSAAGALGYDPRASEKAEEMWLRGMTPDQAKAQMKTNPGLLKKLMARVRGNTSAPDMNVAELAAA